MIKELKNLKIGDSVLSDYGSSSTFDEKLKEMTANPNVRKAIKMLEDSIKILNKEGYKGPSMGIEHEVDKLKSLI